jgi:hypothetical protein
MGSQARKPINLVLLQDVGHFLHVEGAIAIGGIVVVSVPLN